MGFAIRVCGIWIQAPVSISSRNQQTLVFLVGVVALSIAIEVIAFVFMALSAVKTQKRISGVVNEIYESALPVIRSLLELAREMKPKIKSISDNLLETNNVVRAQKQEIYKTLSNANQKTRSQTARFNELIRTSLEVSGGLASAYSHVWTQSRQISGAINELKTEFNGLAACEKFWCGSPRFITLHYVRSLMKKTKLAVKI